jgi:apolipoprotein N-acyltransferase
MWWDFSWPWLVLGNVFSQATPAVQWYEWTGHLGGTFWVLAFNLSVFRFLVTRRDRSLIMNYSKALNLLFVLVIVPLFTSWYIGMQRKPSGRLMRVMVVQPNVDPYKDKFEGMSPPDQTRKMLRIAESKMDNAVQLVVFPETALVGSLNEEDLSGNQSIQLIRAFIAAHPGVVVLTGADSYKFYHDKASRTVTARRYEADAYYDAFNTAMLFDGSDSVQIYHKSKLVPGVEKMPYPAVFRFIEKLAIDLGGTSGSLGQDQEAKVFGVKPFTGMKRTETKVAPVICYESVYGEYVGEYVRKGAELICVITNDGWWGNSPGYVQHFDFAKLRAIEELRWVARAANTGISGFIDPKGNEVAKSSWWVEDALVQNVELRSDETFYAQNGDLVAKVALAVLVINLVVWIRRRRG